jgi:ribA/ribD-fused uncharacterized protein
MLKQRVKTLEDVASNKPFEENDYTTLSARDMGLQLENPSNKLETVDPTQIKALVTSEQKDNVKVPALGLNSKGKIMTVGDIRKLYNAAVSARVEIKYKNKRNLIFTFDSAMSELAISKAKGKLTPNLMSFLKYAQEGLKASQAGSNLLDYFSTIDGEQKYNLNNPITINKFEQLFLSYLSKGTLAEKQPGHALALVSDYGMKVYRRVYSIDENGIPDRSEIIREKVWNKMTSKPNLVEFDTLSGRKIPKEGLVVLDRLRSGVKEYDVKGVFTGQRYTEMLMPAHFQSVMDLVENGTMNMPEVTSKMFAIRIPSQDNHSTINVKHVDFLPAFYGSSAMFSQELVEISGADFDIDKVYAQIKEFYVKEGKFHEYGKATTDSGKYDDYIQYINEKVKKSGTIYAEAFQLYKNDNQSARIQNSADGSDVTIASDAGLSERGIKALQMLGLPITKEQYLEYKIEQGVEPYVAPMNNEILDYKYALMGNTGVTETNVENELPISYTSASLDILINELDELTKLSDVFADRNQEDNVDIDNILGKLKAFASNKGASIGSIVSPNVNLSLLTEYGIKIKEGGPTIIINGITFNDFGVLREQFADETLVGNRKQDIISALITMATDNAKERLIAKLGLNREALSLMANLTALGVPIRTSLLLINNPVIQDLYMQALNKKEKTDLGVEKLTANKIKELALATAESKNLTLTDEILLDTINNIPDSAKKEKTEEEEEAVDLYNRKLLSVLIAFSEALKVKSFTGKMKSVSNLTTGLGQNIASINKKKNDIKELLDPEAMMDLSVIYKKDTWQSKYIEIFNQVSNQILPATFLSASTPFQTILNKTLENVDVNKMDFNEEVLANISKDLLSYITIKAYEYNKLNTDPQSVATLNNNFLYPNENGYESITSVVERLRSTDPEKDNYFLWNFLTSVEAEDKTNQSGLNLANSNTFRSLNNIQKVDLQTSFAKLYGTLETKNDALSIINYIMVKDGLQMGYATLLDAISPFTMGSYLSQIETANQALREGSDEKMKATFGLTLIELEKDFVDGYLKSNINGALLQTYNQDLIYGLPSGIKPDRKNKTATVLWDNVGQPRDIFRVGFTDGITVNYITYNKTEAKEGYYAYEEIETFGSNQQTGIGFMFGERLTYKEVREYVKKKNLLTDASNGIKVNDNQGVIADVAKIRALNNQDANIEATNGEILINDENIADIEKQSVSASSLFESLGIKSEADKSDKVNIYAGTNENAELSNFANRPFTYKGREYKNVEQAFQHQKLMTSAPNSGASNYLNDDIDQKILKAKTGSEAKKLGRQIKQLNTAAWDRISTSVMKNLIQSSFEQNPQALQKLLNTGNATLTHTQDKGKWGSLFPQLLMEVRDQLLQNNSETYTDINKNSVAASSLFDLLGISEVEQHVALTNFWDSDIQNNSGFKSKLREQKILSLEDMIAVYKAGIYESEEAFIESLGCL